ncbi:peptidase [Planctomycetaceae bacterium SCGC AG-212-F19]|nr:peptidase [Planctomycetaceae bacterium SCGC AG-212-F19]
MKRLVPLVCVLSAMLGARVMSADEKPLDAKYLRDHAQTRGFMLGRPVKAKPTPDGKAVLFLRSGPRTPKLGLFEFDVATGKTRELLTPEQVLKGAEEKLSPEEKARRERQRISVGGFTDYQLSHDGSLILLSLSGRLYTVSRPKGEIRELKTGEGTLLDPKFSPDGKMVAYVKDHDLFVYNLADDKEHAATKGGTAEKTHGEAEFVAQEEMDRHNGYWWSPDSKFLAYEEADAKGVETWYVADPAKPGQEPQPFSYPRPGKANVKVRVGIVPVAGGETVWIDWDAKKYEYLTQVRWDKHGPLTITVQNRLQQEIALLLVDPKTGKTTPLLVERDPAWVNLYQDVPRWLPKADYFLWATQTSDWGGPWLEIRDVKNRPHYRVSSGAGYRKFLHVGASDDGLTHYYFLYGNDPTQVHLYRQSYGGPKDEAPKQMTRKPGIHAANFSRNDSVYVLTSTTPGTLPEVTVHRADGTQVGQLPSVAETPGFSPKVEFTKVGADPGFYCAIVRPHGFDPKKKYPVIDYVYGGPGHQVVQQAMRDWLLPQWLADQGFIVVSIDNRGTPNRGRDWERVLYKKFGSVPLDDQVAALQALGKKYPEMDLDRVGIYGWSFGGYMAGLGVLKRPDIFKAAVAGAPVTDWLDYDTHYTERYLGLPEQSPEAYKEASLLTYAPDLKRPLLLIHGTADDNVYFRHTLKLADALFRNGKDFDLLPLSGLTHMVPDPVVMERLYGRIAGHFQKHLSKSEK